MGNIADLHFKTDAKGSTMLLIPKPTISYFDMLIFNSETA